MGRIDKTVKSVGSLGMSFIQECCNLAEKLFYQ